MTDAEQRSLPWVKLWRSKLQKCIPSTMTDSEFRQAIYAYSDYGYYGELPQGLPPLVESVCLSFAEHLDEDRDTRQGQRSRMKANRKGKQKTADNENEDDEDEDAGDGEAVAPAPPVSAAGETVSHADADAPADETSSNGVWSDEELIYQAKRCGLPTTESDLQTARRLAGEYGCLELNTAMQIAFMQKKSVWTFVEGVLKTRKAERKNTLPYNETEIIKQRAQQCGLSTSDGAIGTASGFVREYGMDKVLEAMHIAARSQPTWAYVEGALKNKRADAADQTSH